MTERLYYTDAYLTEFEATVVERGDEGRRIYLDRTAFYPTSGGQPNDLGALAGIPVVDVVDEDDRVAHVLARPLPADARSVTGRIDWRRRFDHMQQHTGQHLLSAVFADHVGPATVGVHFGPLTSTLDLDVDSLPPERAVEAETVANALVLKNRPVTVSFEDAAAVTGLRKPPDRGGTIRVIDIAGIDRSACGGTHVRSTGEIGPILVRRLERVRRTTRVEFICGHRALRRARADHEALAGIARALSVGLDEAADAVRAQTDELRDANAERRRLRDELLRRETRERYDATPPDAAGVRRVVEQRADGAEEMRAFAQAFAALPQTVFVGLVAAPPLLVVSAAEGSGVDAGAAVKAVLAAVGGKGGGSPRLAQASLADPSAMPRVLDLLRELGVVR